MPVLRQNAEYPNQLFGLRLDDNNDVCLYSQNGTLALKILSDGKIVLPALPTLDPHVVGELWNSSGTVKISAG